MTFRETVGFAKLPSEFGTFKIYGYRNTLDNSENIAIVKGDIEKSHNPVMVRIHSECLTGDALGSLRCDCGSQLKSALKMIENTGQGVVIYLAQEGRGIGLLNKVKAYSLQDLGLDTVEANEYLGFSADLRDYSIVAHILKDLGIKQIRLITNNPRKIASLRSCGFEVTERISLITEPNKYNLKYLNTKENKLGHLLKSNNELNLTVNEIVIDEHLEDIWPALLECKDAIKKECLANELWLFTGNNKSAWKFQRFSPEKLPIVAKSDFLILVNLSDHFAQTSNTINQIFYQTKYAILLKNGSDFQSNLESDSEHIKGIWSKNGWQKFSLYLGILIAQRAAHLEKRPFVMAHLAQSLDGKIATINGNSQWISNESNLKHAHRLRALNDAVMIGSKTATMDNPKLTVRLVTGKHPTPVIIQGQNHLKLEDLKMIAIHEKVIVLYPQGMLHHDIPQEMKEKVLQIPIIPVKDSEKTSILSCSEILRVLYENGISSIFIEGGGQTISYLLQADCIGILHLHIAPLILGSGRASFILPAINSIDQGLRFKMKHFDLDGEILIELALIK